MKKLLLGFMAIAAMFATSCQQEQNLTVGEAGETALVSFNLAAPQAVSRSFSDGKTAAILLYAIYDAKGEVLVNISNTDVDQTQNLIFRDDLTQNINVQLTTGNTYTAVFWAVSENALNSGIYTVDWTNKKMVVDYDAAKTLCNDETRDAFYKHIEFKVKGRMEIGVELKRPFAQINIGTNDYEDAANAGYNPQTSKVTVSEVYNTLNFATGEVENPQTVTYDYAAIPRTETFPVAPASSTDKPFEYLAMTYALVPFSAEGKSLVTVKFSYNDPNAFVDAANGIDERSHDRTVGSVPVQRNHRTNIYGQLLTGDITFNVVIKPEYDYNWNQGFEYDQAGENDPVKDQWTWN